MSKKKTTTRLDEVSANGIGEAAQDAARATTRWVRGEVDMVTLIRTPTGEKIVDSYNRETSDAERS